MKIRVNKYKIDYLCLLIFFLSACMQNISLVSFGGVAIKLYHAIALFLAPLLFRRRKLLLPPKSLLFFFLFLFGCSLINIPEYGIDPFLFNYIFAIYSLVLVINMGIRFTQKEWINIIQKVAIVMSILIWIKMAINYGAIIQFFADPSGGHPVIDTFFGGGVNLEASYLAIMVPAFIGEEKKKRGYLYSISCLLICVLYSSRTGIILWALGFLTILLNEKNKKVLFSVCFLGGFAGVIALSKVDLTFFFSRFTSLSKESGVVGRLRMWEYAWALFKQRSIGYGIGNSISALIQYTGKAYSENNFHNLYIQMFIDLGLIGGLYYLILVVGFCVREWKKMIRKPLQAMLLLYFGACMLQFRGAEIVIYFILGAYLQQNFLLKERKKIT